MKRLLALTIAVSLAALIGCSDDKNPASSTPTPPANTATSTWVDSGFWRTTVDASSYDAFAGFSMVSKDTSTAAWDIAFRREVVKLNGGTSTTTGGDAVGANLGVVDFADVTMADTAGVSWVVDAIDYAVDQWYVYTGPPLHQILMTRYVYSMVDAEGDNYIKFQVDSIVGAGMPPDMGTVYIKYYYQPTAGSLTLDGATTSAAIPVNSTTAYFDFSSGSVVTPADPTSSTGWDIAFYAYDLKLNSGTSGPGDCQAFPAFTELTDSTDIDAFTAHPAMADMTLDGPSSAFTEWYNYTGAPLHRLLTKENVYLVKTNDKVYRVKIESYYANIGGVLTSGWYTYIWSEL